MANGPNSSSGLMTNTIRITFIEDITMSDGSLATKETLVGSFTKVALASVIPDLNNRIVPNARDYTLLATKDNCDIGTLQALVKWLSTLNLPISANYKGLKVILADKNWTVKGVIMVHQAAVFLGLDKPVSIKGLRDALFTYLKKAYPEPSNVVELWQRTTEHEDAHLRRMSINIAFDYAERKDGPDVNGGVHKAYSNAFAAHADLNNAYQQRREEYFAFVSRCQVPEEREQEQTERQAQRQAEYEERLRQEQEQKAYELERINRRGVPQSSARIEWRDRRGAEI